jgi:hypothetical protein
VIVAADVVGPAWFWGLILVVAVVQVATQAVAVHRQRVNRFLWGPWKATTQSGRIAVLVWLCVGLAFAATFFVASLL